MYENITIAENGSIAMIDEELEALYAGLETIRDYTDSRVRKTKSLNPNRIQEGDHICDRRSGLRYTVAKVCAGNFTPLELQHQGAVFCAVHVVEDTYRVIDARDCVLS